MRPNIFKIATNELSQDGFLTWLLQWADNKHSEFNQPLNEAAKEFVRLLLGKTSDYHIHKVKADRQWNGIDIWAEINDEYFIGIEDKTNTTEHSEQLERYKQIAKDHYKDKVHKLIFVYLKTGNECQSILKKVIGKGYSVVDRKSLLALLKKHSVDSDIFNAFTDHMNTIEDQTNSYTTFENVTSDLKAAEGFYLKLQDLINESTEWRYVATPTGGFLGFWYHWNKTKEIGEIYIQIENVSGYGIRLVVKVGSWDPSVETLYKLLNELKPFADNNKLLIEKPNRYKAGSTSTLAIIPDAFKINGNGSLDLEQFARTLGQLEKTVDDYCKSKDDSI